MRILFFGNNWLGWQVLRYLRETNEKIVGLVIHPKSRLKYGKEILSEGKTLGLPPERIFDGSRLRDPNIIGRIKKLKPDMGISILFGYIIKLEIIDLFPEDCFNLHTGLLPYNRGVNPNVWSIIEGTPSGVSLHRIDNNVDSGPVLACKEVEVSHIDTGATLYKKIINTGLEMFKEIWFDLKNDNLVEKPQSNSGGTFHTSKDLTRTDLIDLDAITTGRDLLNQIRARTFESYPSSYFIENGKKIYIRVKLEYR